MAEPLSGSFTPVIQVSHQSDKPNSLISNAFMSLVTYTHPAYVRNSKVFPNLKERAFKALQHSIDEFFQEFIKAQSLSNELLHPIPYSAKTTEGHLLHIYRDIIQCALSSPETPVTPRYYARFEISLSTLTPIDPSIGDPFKNVISRVHKKLLDRKINTTTALILYERGAAPLDDFEIERTPFHTQNSYLITYSNNHLWSAWVKETPHAPYELTEHGVIYDGNKGIFTDPRRIWGFIGEHEQRLRLLLS